MPRRWCSCSRHSRGWKTSATCTRMSRYRTRSCPATQSTSCGLRRLLADRCSAGPRSMRDARTLRVEVSPAIGTEVDGMREPCRTRRGTELRETSGAFREVQVPQSDAGNNDCHYPNDPTREDIAECEQSHRNHRNGDGDSAQLQCAAGAALEVSADRLSHTPFRPRELWDEGLYCGISFDDPSISGPAAGTRLE